MPTIGPKTVENAIAAGIEGIMVGSGTVLILEKEKVMALAKEVGLSLWAEGLNA